MKTFKIINKYIVALGTLNADIKYQLPLSNLIKQNFGDGSYNQTTITKIISFCLEYYAAEFERICQNENSYTFYKMIFWLNEQANELRTDKKASENFPKEIDFNYFAKYRRILKMILEQGCSIKMVVKEKMDTGFKKKFQPIFDDLIYLGDEVISCAENYAEQEMIEDSIDVLFNERGLFYFKRKHYFEDAFRKIVNMNVYDPSSFVIDNTGEEDFIDVVKDSFGIDFNNVINVINESMIHLKLKVGDVVAIGRKDLSKGMNQLFNVPNEKAEDFFSGMYFTEKHKHIVKELATKPYSINRFLYRPILIWNVDGNDFCVFGIFSIQEAMASLYLNAFPWCKAPDEWKKNAKFKKFIDKKSDEHDKWLDDAVEKEIKTTNLSFQRDVKSIRTKNEFISIDNSACGQIDFLALNEATNKIFVIECKHLLGRYEMANQKIDFYNFTSDNNNKSYNRTLEKKVKWVNANINSIEEHFKIRNENPLLSIASFTVEGIFIINTPTFYMYTSEFRIYTYHSVAKVLENSYVDKTYTLLSVEDDVESIVFIRYPYFKKKKMLYYNDPDDDCEVDKYGYPIK